MKEQYIRQVEKELKVPRNRKREILRDLQEAFASALEHGETEAQVIQRLGGAKEFAHNAAEQFGVDLAARKKRNGILVSVAAAALGAVAFGAYGAARLQSGPEGVIGQGNAMTNIQVVGPLDVNVENLLLAAGILLACTALISIIRTARKTRGR